jgi:hypothetical protein
MNVTYKYHTNNASLYIMELDIIKLIFRTGFSTTYPLGAESHPTRRTSLGLRREDWPSRVGAAAAAPLQRGPGRGTW